MSLEAFLINPARRTRKRKTSRGIKRKRSGGLPGSLLSRMIRTHGRKRGMSEAWKAYRGGARNPRKPLPARYHSKDSLGRPYRHRPVVYGTEGAKGWARSPYSLHKDVQFNPFGEEVMIVGANPRRRRKRVRRHKSLFGNPVRRHRRRYSMKRRANPIRRYTRRHVSRRRYRRNAPAGEMTISARRPMSLLMPALAGTGGYFMADYIPAAIGMSATPLTRIGVKAGIAFAGSMLLSKFVGKKGATAFALGAGINLVNDALRTYVFKTTTTTGFGAFTRPQLRGMGAMSPYGSSGRSPYAS